jgi:hypothetical protein
MGSKAGRSHVLRFYSMLNNSGSPAGMSRLNSNFLRPSTAPEASLVTARALWLSSSELAVADLVYSLSHGRYLQGIVQQAEGRSAETLVSTHHNNQSTMYPLVLSQDRHVIDSYCTLITFLIFDTPCITGFDPTWHRISWRILSGVTRNADLSRSCVWDGRTERWDTPAYSWCPDPKVSGDQLVWFFQ